MTTCIGDLQGKEGTGIPNHDPHTLTGGTSRAKHLRFRGDTPTWGEVRDYFASQPEGHILKYHNSEGGLNNRPGFRKSHKEGHSGVLTGQNPDVNPFTNLPLSIRERARVQGFPDDFIFYGTKIEPDGTWNTETSNAGGVKATGKAMPWEFNRYVAKLIANHIQGKDTKEITGQRFLPDNPFVKEAKQWFCKNIGYSNQEKACEYCHSNSKCNYPGGI
jgi:site-specific DNA-cytosine methylase